MVYPQVIPAARAKVAQDALLGALHSLVEGAIDVASSATAVAQMEQVAELCADAGKAAAVITMISRRSEPGG